MATISSHVLDSVIGTHAAGIRVECFRREHNGATMRVLDCHADEQGRICETLNFDQDDQHVQYELVFHAKAYFAKQALPDDGYQVLSAVVLRLDLPDAQGNYHLPIMLSPHSYSVWWSGAPA